MTNRVLGYMPPPDCDIPHEWFVEMCCQFPDRFGMLNPGDVPWHHKNRARSVGIKPVCRCGRDLPPIGPCDVYSPEDDEVTVYTGQCLHCNTIFWTYDE